MNGFQLFVVETTSPTASLLAATTGSWPAKGPVIGSFRNSSCQATPRAAAHLIAVTATPVLPPYTGDPTGPGRAAAPAPGPATSAPAGATGGGGCPLVVIGRTRLE